MRRLEAGGRIDRAQRLRFEYDGAEYEGFAGDTLASALLANGVRVIGQSPYASRPRGVYSAGSEEPNALVQLGAHPLATATCVQLFDGLAASSCAGKGRLTDDPQRGRYDKRHAHCDVLVVGGGPAGLAAATAAARTGARVILADEQPEIGGTLLGAPRRIGGVPSVDWIAEARLELELAPEARVLTDTSVFGAYDHGCFMAAQRWDPDHGRLWQIRASRAVIATGAHERPFVFAGNDLPGVMLAGAVGAYAHRYAVVPSGPVVVFTNNDSAYAVALELTAAGADVAAIVDARHELPETWAERARSHDIQLLAEHVVVSAQGVDCVHRVWIAPLTPDGKLSQATVEMECEVVAVSGGFDPVVHLFSQAQGRSRYDAELACFVPDDAGGGLAVAGAAAGAFGLSQCVRGGIVAGARAAHETGFGHGRAGACPDIAEPDGRPIRPLWAVPAAEGDWSTHFVDFQRDATVADIAAAVDAGLQSMEHVKRHTTIGTGADQGKTSSVAATVLTAAALGRPLGQLGPTTIRPPYRPVAFELIAARNRGPLHDPVRVSPIHEWHVARGAAFEDVGQWKRPWYYPRDGETMEKAVLRECRSARESAAVMDASTLGKIELQGPDAVEFLNRLYTNRFDTLAVGFARYGVMCRPDGMVFDDGVVMRLEQHRFLATTTTGNAAAVMDWMEEWLQTEWPGLRVRCTSVTEQWATIAVVGPRARDVLFRLTDISLDVESFPFMAIREGVVAGAPARVVRVSFSGELAFEVSVSGWHGKAVWRALIAAGEPEGITPYGTETMHVLRAEKGYVIVGQDTDGTVTPVDLGMDWIVSRTKGDFVGLRSLQRPDTLRRDRKQLVGLLPSEDVVLPEGAQLVADPDEPVPMTMVGHVTSSYRSAALDRPLALGLVDRGRERVGDILYAPLVDRIVPALVTTPVFYDAEGARRDG